MPHSFKSSLGVARFINQSSGATVGKSESLTRSENIEQSEIESVKKTKQLFENTEKQNKIVSPKPLTDNFKTSTVSKPTEIQKPASMNQFLSVVEKLSADKERLTGNGRLDMGELVTALQNFQHPTCQPSDTYQSQLNINIAPAQTTAAGAPKFSHVNFKPVANIPRQETPKQTQSEEPVRSETDNVKSPPLMKSNHANFNSVPTSYRANNFHDEKNNLLGELKTKLNQSEDDCQVQGNNAISAKRNFTPTNPDQVVNKIVYNQYREMLNSYKSNK